MLSLDSFWEDTRKYWADLRSIGPVVIVTDGLRDGTAYYLTRREDMLEVLLDPNRYVRTAPSPTRRAVDLTRPLLRRREVNADMSSPLRERAAAAIDSVAVAVASGKAVMTSEIGSLFADHVFFAMTGISYREELPQAVSEHRTAFLSKLVDQAGNPIDDAEAVDLVEMLVLAGHEALAAAANNAVREFLVKPELYDELREGPQRVADFVDELVGTVSTTITRETTAAVTVAGVEIPAGSRVELCVGAPADGPGGRLDFGTGLHQCIGRHLSVLALTAFVQEWLTL
ncbi:hypothetical protein [Mycolicibacterium sphagni]|uniref:Cytochrome P450 n=1 Tax=Mycolicibacterium sphagni TaxID=1786 RepID=A0ABX2JPH3_9MYCO|nr:hypothetical protein [Mycolicibacterium sphagni]NTY58669.1 hypothetical protein [Mycolicibacterium sphagni]